MLYRSRHGMYRTSGGTEPVIFYTGISPAYFLDFSRRHIV